MTASELHRKLLYCGYNDLAEYLKNSPLNRYIYKQLLVLRPKYAIESSILAIFNEVYYQCVKIQSDRKPGFEIGKRYLEEEARWLDSSLVAELVFSIVLALERKKCELSFHDECFIGEMMPLLESSQFLSFTSDIVRFIDQKNIFIPYWFLPMTCQIREIPEYLPIEDSSLSFFEKLWMRLGLGVTITDKHHNAWKTLTDNYTFSYIEDYLRLFSYLEDQQALLSIIRKNYWPGRDARVDFELLKNNIQEGQYQRAYSLLYDSLNTSLELNTDEEPDSPEYLQAKAFLANYDVSQTIEIKQLKQELDDARSACEAQRVTFEQEIAQMKARHLAEIEQWKKKVMLKTRQPKNAPKHNNADTRGKDETPREKPFSLEQMVEYIKQRYSKLAAEEFVNMYYHLATKNKNLDESMASIIDEIIPAILQRDKPSQSVNIPSVGQVYINPQNVHNHEKEDL